MDNDTVLAYHYRCRKCGMFPSQHPPSGACSSPSDPYHTTGKADYVRVKGAPDRYMTPEDFIAAVDDARQL